MEHILGEGPPRESHDLGDHTHNRTLPAATTAVPSSDPDAVDLAGPAQVVLETGIPLPVTEDDVAATQ